MRKRRTPVDRSTIAADRATLKAIQSMGNYQPANPLYSLENLLLHEQAVTQAELSDDRAAETRTQTREVRQDSYCVFHDIMLGAKDQITAQFGSDSYEIKAIGRIRKSERKQPRRSKSSS